MSEILELQEADFDAKVLQETRPVLVDFWSPTCGPCRALAPVVAALAQANGDSAVIAKANALWHLSQGSPTNLKWTQQRSR
ncbi:MAG: hypothetical protein IJO40_15900 [Thermoguttaceae bacterium]|nr:hypothetical protein [Thermoguttaceae bacterium]